ncbi:hypothetical protein GOV14_03595 [Candidatus Pacearchaeota archaeon]|nr:hypothetical protein [Candidatus Pacearchaeota archaeon]
MVITIRDLPEESELIGIIITEIVKYGINHVKDSEKYYGHVRRLEESDSLTQDMIDEAMVTHSKVCIDGIRGHGLEWIESHTIYSTGFKYCKANNLITPEMINEARDVHAIRCLDSVKNLGVYAMLIGIRNKGGLIRGLSSELFSLSDVIERQKKYLEQMRGYGL